jgi:hypothetical protein
MSRVGLVGSRVAALRRFADAFGYSVVYSDSRFWLDFPGFPARAAVYASPRAVSLLAVVPFCDRRWDITDAGKIAGALAAFRGLLSSRKRALLAAFLREAAAGLPFVVHNSGRGLSICHGGTVLSVAVGGSGALAWRPLPPALASAANAWDPASARAALRALLPGDGALAGVESALRRGGVAFGRVGARSLSLSVVPFRALLLKVSAGGFRLSAVNDAGCVTVAGLCSGLRFGACLCRLLLALSHFARVSATAAFLARAHAGFRLSFAHSLSLAVDLPPPRPSLVFVQVSNLRAVGRDHFVAGAACPALSVSDCAIPPYLRHYFTHAVRASRLPELFPVLVKSLRGPVNSLHSLFIAPAREWSIYALSTELSFHLCYRNTNQQRYCMNVIFRPPDAFQFFVAPFGPSAILLLPLASFPQFSRRGDGERRADPSAHFTIAELPDFKRKIDAIFAERQLLINARYTPFKPGPGRTMVIPTCPTLPDWIALSVTLSGQGIAVQVHSPREDAARAIARFVALEIPDHALKLRVYRFIFQLLDPTIDVARWVLDAMHEAAVATEGELDWPAVLASGEVTADAVAFTVAVRDAEYRVSVARGQPGSVMAGISTENGKWRPVRLRSDFAAWLIGVLRETA